MRPSVTRQGVTRRDARALCSVSHDGLVNTGSFQKNGLLAHRVHQHAARYPAGSDGLVARRALGAGDRPALTLPHRLKADDGRNALAEYDGARWTALGERTGATGTSPANTAPAPPGTRTRTGTDHDTRGRPHAPSPWRERDAVVTRGPGGLTDHGTGHVPWTRWTRTARR
ncbi:hypothetical protein [Streptomyces olivaceoviridis]|uniref:hypothetical protein n=1 Tax=Streptomyces olivaceoviridis TaxID=1921 RepID=UPI0036ABC073